MRPLALLIAIWPSLGTLSSLATAPAARQDPVPAPVQDAPIRVHGVLVDVDGAPIEGATTLEPAAVLVGHIVDSAGALLTEGWTVIAAPRDRVRAANRVVRRSIAKVDAVSGMFRFDDLAAGEFELTASDGRQMRVDRTLVTSKAGEETSVELRYTGPDASRRLLATISTRPFYVFRPEVGSVRAIAADGDAFMLRPVPGRANDWDAVGVPPGAYRLEVRDPRFGDWTQAGVLTGTVTRVQLVGSATLEVEVVDLETGAPVEGYALKLAYPNAHFSPNEFVLLDWSASAPPPAPFTGIVPGDIELIAMWRGLPPARARVDSLRAGETRRVRIEVGPGSTLTGRVVDAAGVPLRGLTVELTRGDIAGHSGRERSVMNVSYMLDGAPQRRPVARFDEVATTALDGSFTFVDLAPGAYVLRAAKSAWCSCTARVELPRDGTASLVMPPVAPVDVRVVLPAGAEFERVGLGIDDDADWANDPAGSVEATFLRVPCGVDGAFPTLELPIGARTLTVSLSRSSPLMPYLTGRLDFHSVPIDVVAGEAQSLELDLRTVFPVLLRVSARTEATSASALADDATRVWLVPRQPGSDATDSREQGGSFSGYDSASDGVTFEFLVAKGRYGLRFDGLGWSWSLPDDLVLGAALEARVIVTVPLVTRRVRVLDGDGAPRAMHRVTFWNASTPERRGAFLTDGEGYATLCALPGTLEFASSPSNEARPATDLAPAIRIPFEASRAPLLVTLVARD